VARLDDGADEAGDANAVRTHLERRFLAVRPLHNAAHGLRIFGAEEEDVADLDAAGRETLVLGDLRLEGGGVVLLVGRGVEIGARGDDGGEVRLVVDVVAGDGHVHEVAVAEDRALARFGEYDEFMAHVAADGAGVGGHRDRAQAQAVEGAQISDEHLAVGAARALDIEVEGIGVLHQEFAATHDAEAGADLVAELPLDVEEVARQVAVGLHGALEDFGDHLLIGGAIEHVALVAILDAEHFGAIGVVAARLAPEIGGLERRHEEFDGACPRLLLADDLLDVAQHGEAHRQPGIDAGGGLADEARAQHQPMGDDLGFGGVFPEGGQKISGKAHDNPESGGPGEGQREAGPRSPAGA